MSSNLFWPGAHGVKIRGVRPRSSPGLTRRASSLSRSFLFGQHVLQSAELVEAVTPPCGCRACRRSCRWRPCSAARASLAITAVSSPPSASRLMKTSTLPREMWLCTAVLTASSAKAARQTHGGVEVAVVDAFELNGELVGRLDALGAAVARRHFSFVIRSFPLELRVYCPPMAMSDARRRCNFRSRRRP